MNTSPADLKYRAFISCSSADDEWGRWLQNTLQSYRVPKRLIGSAGRDGPVPVRLRPIFRDRESYPSSAVLDTPAREALEQSAYLIVVCSPDAAASQRVSSAILAFKQLGRENRILALIADGEPNASDKPGPERMLECFPEVLRHRLKPDGRLSEELSEPIAADARPQGDGKAAARLKLAAGLLGVGYEALKQRELEAQRRAARIYQSVAAGMALLAILAVGAGITAYRYMKRSDAMAQAAVETASNLASLGYKTATRASVPLAIIKSFQTSTDHELTRLAGMGIESPELSYRHAMLLMDYSDDAGSGRDAARQRATAEEAIASLQDLTRRHPDVLKYQYALADGYQRLGRAFERLGHAGRARNAYARAADIRDRENATKEGKLYTAQMLDQGENDVAGKLLHQGRTGEALAHFRHAVAVNEERLAARPGDPGIQNGLFQSHTGLGDALLAAGQPGSAVDAYKNALTIRQFMIANNAGNSGWQADEIVTRYKIGHALLVQGKVNQALDYYRSSLAGAQNLAASQPDKDANAARVWIIANLIANQLGDSGQPDPALEFYMAAYESVLHAPMLDPRQAQYQDLLAISFMKLAMDASNRRNTPLALAHLGRAAKILENLIAKDPDNALWRNHLVTVYDGIRGLSGR